MEVPGRHICGGWAVAKKSTRKWQRLLATELKCNFPAALAARSEAQSSWEHKLQPMAASSVLVCGVGLVLGRRNSPQSGTGRAEADRWSERAMTHLPGRRQTCQILYA